MGRKDAAAGFPIEPPIEPMLAKLAPELPAGDGWLFEPKWDGFRAIVFRDRYDQLDVTPPAELAEIFRVRPP